MEAKANRETIMRLAAEVSREQKRAASWALEKDKLNQVQWAEGASVPSSQSRNAGADVLKLWATVSKGCSQQEGRPIVGLSDPSSTFDV